MGKKIRKLYKKGAEWENKIKTHLEMQGFYVMRSAGSKGPADLIAINPKEKIVNIIQVKTYKESLTEKQKDKLLQKIPIKEGKYHVRLKVL